MGEVIVSESRMDAMHSYMYISMHGKVSYSGFGGLIVFFFLQYSVCYRVVTECCPGFHGHPPNCVNARKFIISM